MSNENKNPKVEYFGPIKATTFESTDDLMDHLKSLFVPGQPIHWQAAAAPMRKKRNRQNSTTYLPKENELESETENPSKDDPSR